MVAVVYPGTKLFKLVELYFGDGLEMAGHSAITLGILYTITACSYHGLEMYVFVCNVKKYLYYRGTLMSRLQNSHQRKKMVYF